MNGDRAPSLQPRYEKLLLRETSAIERTEIRRDEFAVLPDQFAVEINFTPGQAYEDADNGNRSQVHWDMVCIQRPDYGGGEVYFDGKLIRKDGEFVPANLRSLNRGRFAKK